MPVRVRSFLQDDAGATAVEYGLFLSLTTLVCIGAFYVFGSQSGGMWDRVGSLVGAALR